MAPRKCEVEFNSKAIETLVAAKATDIEEWIRHIYTLLNENGAVVGLCIQCKPNASNKPRNKAATLQICVDNKCLIIQLSHLDLIPEPLKLFMLDPCFTFVGMGTNGCDIFHKLKYEYGLVCGRFERIHHMGRKKSRPMHDLFRKILPRFYVESSEPSLMALAKLADVSSVEIMPMEIFLSNWEASILNSIQIKYGCIYAYTIYKMGLKMLKKSSDKWV